MKQRAFSEILRADGCDGDSVGLLKAELLSRIPHADLYVLPGTGHLSPLESPQELGRLIGDFAAARVAGEPNRTDGKTKRSDTEALSANPISPAI
jgi:hypothetical protein